MYFLSFALGVLGVQQLAMLPDTAVAGTVAGLLMVAAFVPVGVRRFRTLIRACAALAAGSAWAILCGNAHLQARLPVALEGQDITLVGVVASLPQTVERGVRFEFDVEHGPVGVPGRLSLAWYQGRYREHEVEEWYPSVDLHAGSRWQLVVRLKRPHGHRNPHGQDFEAWLFERGLGATGHVRATVEHRAKLIQLDASVLQPGALLARARERIRARFDRALPDAPHLGLLKALAIGDQAALGAAQWEIFSRTGTTHLVSISGLHVTMIAALFGGLCAALWRRVPALALRWPAQQAGRCSGVLGAALYCGLAGFGVPAQRTLIMLASVMLARVCGHRAGAVDSLCLALFVVLLWDPMAVVSAGFWLSFGAVAVLFFVSEGRLGTHSAWRDWLRAQWAVTLAGVPVLLALFQQLSLVSPLANLLAIPLVSLLLTPVVLLAAVLPLDALVWSAHAIAAVFIGLMSQLSALSWASWQLPAPGTPQVLLALCACLLGLAPAGWPGRWLAPALFLPLLCFEPARPAQGGFELTVLDVGQGLSVHVRTAQHDLLYDTGPRFSADTDAGQRLVRPYLRAVGASTLDALVVTHADSDHSGGAHSVLTGVSVKRLLVSLPPTHELRLARPDAQDCLAGTEWHWEGVRFRLLHPSPEALGRGNNGSCVLRIDSPYGSALLTGDIEASAEHQLIVSGQALGADVLVVPHHGSRSSSTPEFLAAVLPDIAVFASGYRNRFHHPHPQIAQRYAALGARMLRTDLHGAVRIAFTPEGRRTQGEREQGLRYWHNRVDPPSEPNP